MKGKVLFLFALINHSDKYRNDLEEKKEIIFPEVRDVDEEMISKYSISICNK